MGYGRFPVEEQDSVHDCDSPPPFLFSRITQDDPRLHIKEEQEPAAEYQFGFEANIRGQQHEDKFGLETKIWGQQPRVKKEEKIVNQDDDEVEFNEAEDAYMIRKRLKKLLSGEESLLEAYLNYMLQAASLLQEPAPNHVQQHEIWRKLQWEIQKHRTMYLGLELASLLTVRDKPDFLSPWCRTTSFHRGEDQHSIWIQD